MSAGIYIDDSGTPGSTSPSRFLHRDRKSWAAVIVPESIAPDVETAMQIFLAGVKVDHGAEELHFPEIYGGRGSFKGVPGQTRHKLFELMVHLFQSFQLPIIFQTCSLEYCSEIHARFPAISGRFDFLDNDDHEHLGLHFLLFRVHEFVREHKEHFPRTLPVFVDEGLAKADAVLRLPHFASTMEDGLVRFQKSHKRPFLQLADFAAFVIARQQWLAARGNLNTLDREFLQIVDPRRLCVINLPSGSIPATSMSSQAYDELLKVDRRAKGLPEEPPNDNV